jgi:senataxin
MLIFSSIFLSLASQSLEADFLLPLRFKCTKLILVGDPLQLPPCVLSDAGKDYGLSLSLYARLYDIFKNYADGPVSMLDTQYRMHPDICQFPSDYFYSERLQTDPTVATRMRHFTLKPLYVYNVTSPHSRDEASSSCNEGEARLIRDFCGMLVAHLAQQPSPVSSDNEDGDDDDESSTSSSSNSTHDSDDDSIHEEKRRRPLLLPLANGELPSQKIQQSIAVITPYKAQVRLLRSYLPSYIEIMTVDSSQGKEKDIVIVSCVLSGTIGFLDDMNRVNVMLTRSKNALYVFGNLTQLASLHEGWRAFVDHAQRKRIFCDLGKNPLDLPYRQ